jgi:hypothetical protein
MTDMTDEIIKRSRAGLDYMEFKLRDYEKEIKRLQQDLALAIEELERERRSKCDER